MKKNLANYISAIRIIISPVVVYWLLVGNFELATSLYLLGLFTDVVDGYIARKLDVVSDFGMIWDPITSVVLFYSTSFKITKRKKLKNGLHMLDIIIGAGIGDIGLGLLMTFIFMPDLFIIITLSVITILLMKLISKRYTK